MKAKAKAKATDLVKDARTSTAVSEGQDTAADGLQPMADLPWPVGRTLPLALSPPRISILQRRPESPAPDRTRVKRRLLADDHVREALAEDSAVGNEERRKSGMSVWRQVL